MTTRERWILYPLLFLTLGIAMRDKVIPPRLKAWEITANSVSCGQLDVGRLECRAMAITSSDGAPGVQMRFLPRRGGWIEVRGKDGQTVAVVTADQASQSGVVETYDANEAPQVQLRSNEAGGSVTTIPHDKRTLLVVGQYDEQSGVFAESFDLGQRVLVTLPWKFDTVFPLRQLPGRQPTNEESAGDDSTDDEMPAAEGDDENPDGESSGDEPSDGQPQRSRPTADE